MTKCPSCGVENMKYEEYYDVDGEHCITLRFQRDKCYVKIWNLKKLLEE